MQPCNLSVDIDLVQPEDRQISNMISYAGD